jgi:uncharacterized spore protein YtfJ
MQMPYEKLLDSMTNFMHDEVKTETIIGKPFTLGEFSCIPVIRAGMGFGTGGGEGEAPKQGHGTGGGAGAGLGIEPIGFLVSKGDQISFISTKTNNGLAAAFEKVPDLIEKFLDQKVEKEEPVLAD